MTNILDGKSLSDEITMKIKEEVNKMNTKPKLVVINIGDDEASTIYVNMKKKKCEEIGILFEHLKLSATIKENQVIDEIIKLNNDQTVTGILIQLPLPSSLNKDLIINTVDPKKDVDGLTNINLLNIINNQPGLVPCTPKGIISLLNNYGISVAGKKVVIINRSKLVGLPLFHLLLNMNATVTVCHSHTENLKEITQTADIIITAVGKKNFITHDMIKKDSIIIDVGITRDDDQKIYGDVDFTQCQTKASYITPVPKGVGPMTVISIIENIIQSQKMSN